MLSAEGISYGTRDREILYEISLRAEAGEFVGIIGPNAVSYTHPTLPTIA